MSQYTYEEKAMELRREVLVRERVYPRWVRDGKISKDTAAYRIAILEEVTQELEERAAKERLV